MHSNDYEALFAEIITKMDARDAATVVAATPKPSKLARVSAIVKIAAASGAILIAASLVFRQPQAARRTTFTVATGADGIDAIDRNAIANIKNWKPAKQSDLRQDFADWLRRYGVEPAGKMELDAKGAGVSSGAAYLLITDKAPGIKRTIWMVDHRAVYDSVGKIQGIAKIPKASMSRISWSDNGAPIERPEGDGLLVVRDYTSAYGTTVFFVKNGKLCSGIVADISGLQLR